MPKRLLVLSFELLCDLPDTLTTRCDESVCLLIVVVAKERVFDDHSFISLAGKERIRPTREEAIWYVFSLAKDKNLLESV